jgi:hypothetical protein
MATHIELIQRIAVAAGLPSPKVERRYEKKRSYYSVRALDVAGTEALRTQLYRTVGNYRGWDGAKAALPADAARWLEGYEQDEFTQFYREIIAARQAREAALANG